MKIMKCECCGKTFYTEYWQGNYIDHVENFAQHREALAHSCNVKDMAKKIVFNGADFREEWCIKEFIKCFMKWDCFSEDFKQRVKQIVDATLLNIKKAKRTAERLEKKNLANCSCDD